MKTAKAALMSGFFVSVCRSDMLTTGSGFFQNGNNHCLLLVRGQVIRQRQV
tara:strand:- start:85 stop:237 length:153 start_codon:yes stop_codon:yes gene_type:complete